MIKIRLRGWTLAPLSFLRAVLLSAFLLGAAGCATTDGPSRPTSTRCAEDAVVAYHDERYGCAFRIAPSTVTGHEVRAKVAIRFGKLERAEEEINAALDSLESRRGGIGGGPLKNHLRNLLRIVETPR